MNWPALIERFNRWVEHEARIDGEVESEEIKAKLVQKWARQMTCEQLITILQEKELESTKQAHKLEDYIYPFSKWE